MSLFSGDNELGNILQEAVKIKSAQMGQKRKTYETWPYFVQHTIFHGEKDNFRLWRELDFEDKMPHCEEWKAEGNRLYQAGQYSDAVDRYEEAATIIYYCYSNDPGWRKNNRGIDDDVITLVVDEGTTDEHKEQHRKMRVALCLNIAQCKNKLAKFDEAVVACTTALELDPDNVKGLYRRAEARVRPGRSTGYDHDCAVKDLARAHKLDPTNQSVKTLLKDLRVSQKDQKDKDQSTFAGMFGRGSIYKEELEKQALQLANKPAGSGGGGGGMGSIPEPDLQSLQQRIDNISEEDSLEKRVSDAELLRDLYMRNGKEDEAKELNEKIQVAKKALKERSSDRASGKTGLDWENPTEEMIEDAKKHDLDLTDPMVVEELKRLEKEGLDGKSLEDLEKESQATWEGGASAARASSGYDLPVPEFENATPVPWLRYIILFAIIFIFWKIVDIGVPAMAAKWVWRRLTQVQDPEQEEGGRGLLASFIGGDSGGDIEL